MELTPYYYAFYQGAEVTAQVWLNGIPIMRLFGGQTQTRTAPAIHLLQPADNWFRIDVLDAPKDQTIYFELCVDWDHEHPAYRFDWPAMVQSEPDEKWVPMTYETGFTPLGQMFRPAYLDATPQAFGEDGTAELRAVVERLHQAAERRNVDEWVRLLAFRVDELGRAYPGWEGQDQKQAYAEMAAFFSQNVAVRPLEWDKVRFLSCQGGRVACAIHKEGGQLIEVVSRDDPTQYVRVDPVMTRHQGEWKIFR